MLPIDTTALHRLGTKKPVTTLAEFSIEARRLALLGKRLSKRDNTKYAPTDMDPFKEEREVLETKRNREVIENGDLSLWTERPLISDYVSIIDIDANGPDEGIREIRLPFIPRELEWNIDSNFVAIKPIGRNNAKYHYTGSEDTLEFEIDWHSYDLNRDDVIKNCRAIEALSKNDSYDNPPHRVLIKWGQEDVLFRDIVFLVVSAPYKMTQFNKSQFYNGTVQRTAMLPIQARQKVRLARITSHNLSHNEIRTVQSTKYY